MWFGLVTSAGLAMVSDQTKPNVSPEPVMCVRRIRHCVLEMGPGRADCFSGEEATGGVARPVGERGNTVPSGSAGDIAVTAAPGDND